LITKKSIRTIKRFHGVRARIGAGITRQRENFERDDGVAQSKSADTWDTGAYDWVAIGQAADVVKIPLPGREMFAGDPSGVETYLMWAVGRVDRYKLQLTFR